MKILRTSDIARAAGLHPNTIRLYERWGLLQPVPRRSNGYRQFTPMHLEQVKLVRIMLKCTILGGTIRKTAYSAIYATAGGDYDTALEMAYRHLEMIKNERAQAEIAVELLEHWVHEALPDSSDKTLTIRETAALLDVTCDMLRNWERNGLVSVPRDSKSGYRRYGTLEIKRLRIIRTLRRARYSTMSILRTINYLDEGKHEDLRHVLDTPDPRDDILYISDSWLPALLEIEKQAGKMIEQVLNMISKQHDS